MSVPDLDLIVEMADFFDTSVDVLLGYKMKDNRLQETVRRLKEYRRMKDRAGLSEAEKALKKYPHSFDIVHECAILFSNFGFESGDRDLLRKALELLEQSRLLLGQNTDPQINEQILYGQMATAYLGLDETDKAIELLKAHNAGGIYNYRIGSVLAICERTDEAVPFLSESLAKIVSDLINTIVGYINVFFQKGDYASAQAILQWGTEIFPGLRKDGKANYLDKINSGLIAALAGAQFMSGQEAKARDSLNRAKRLALFFDGSPSYSESDIRFISFIEGASAYDDIGATAMDAINNCVNGIENEEFAALWKSVSEQTETEGKEIMDHE